MFRILIIGLIIFFATPFIIRGLLKLINWYLKRKFNNYIRNEYEQAFYDFFGQETNDDSQSEAESRRAAPRTHRQRRGKRIHPGEGEYVEFEDIRETRTVVADDTRETFAREDTRIVDVEWEDID